MFLVVLTVLLVVFLVDGGVSGGPCIGLDSSSFEFYVHGGARLLGASLETPGDLFGASVEPHLYNEESSTTNLSERPQLTKNIFRPHDLLKA